MRSLRDRGTTDAVIDSSSLRLHMHRLDGTAFDVAGVTIITHELLEYHKTIEAYRLAKAILVKRVAAEGGTVVFNADDDGATSMADHAEGADVRWFSMRELD